MAYTSNKLALGLQVIIVLRHTNVDVYNTPGMVLDHNSPDSQPDIL